MNPSRCQIVKPGALKVTVLLVPVLAVVCADLLAGTPNADADHGVINLGSKTFMLIDHWGISRMRGVEMKANPPTRRQRVFQREKPWESLSREYSCVLDDGTGEYKMYLHSEGSSYSLLTSTDGINWKRPNIGRIDFEGSKQNNLVMSGTYGVGGAVLFDPRDSDPSRRYKFLTSDKDIGLKILTSPDGYVWTDPKVQVIPYAVDSQAVLGFDPYINKYVAFLRGSHEDRRVVMRAESDNPMRPWPYKGRPDPPQATEEYKGYLGEQGVLPMVLAPDGDDPPMTDFYGNQVFIYPWAERVYLAFPTVYYWYRNARGYLAPPDAPDANVGVGESNLAVSRDGIHWTRYRRPAYVKHGWHGDHYAYWTWVLQGMIRRDQKIYQYVILKEQGHGGAKIKFIEGSTEELAGLVLFEQKLDRFVAAQFDYTGGVIVTEPILFQGDRLVINANTGGAGEGRVGLRRADGTQIPDYSVDDCDIISGDWLAKTVSWKRGQNDVGPFAGQPIRLEFRMRGTDLFAFRFKAE